jgi:hypothetical protein
MHNNYLEMYKKGFSKVPTKETVSNRYESENNSPIDLDEVSNYAPSISDVLENDLDNKFQQENISQPTNNLLADDELVYELENFDRSNSNNSQRISEIDNTELTPSLNSNIRSSEIRNEAKNIENISSNSYDKSFVEQLEMMQSNLLNFQRTILEMKKEYKISVEKYKELELEYHNLQKMYEAQGRQLENYKRLIKTISNNINSINTL